VSGGPATEDGKAVVRWNATRHGISSPAPVVPGLEKREDWESHLEGVFGNLSPVGHLEVTLTERVALLSWRLHRVTRYETQAIAISQERIEEDIHKREMFVRSLRERNYASTHPEDVRFEAEQDRRTHNALKRFPSLAPEKTMSGEDASSVVWGVLMVAKRWSGEIDVEQLELPGVPEDAMIEELPSMRASEVNGCVRSIALAAGRDSDELLLAATEEARSSRVGSEHRKEEMEGEVSRHRRERILPDEKTLEKIARYEAHLSRQMYQALHELENLQRRRTTGEGVPLARLDVNGGIVSEG
jgi:hypothetical protein